MLNESYAKKQSITRIPRKRFLLLMLPVESYIMPYGIMYISAALKREGYCVYTQNLTYIKTSLEEFLKAFLIDHKIDCVALGGYSWECSKMRRVFSVVKQINPNIITVAGGGIITTAPMVAMKALECDIGVVGEGEVAICELAKAIEDNKFHELERINGILFRSVNEITQTQARQPVRDLDSYPLPDREGFGYSVFMEQNLYFGIFASRSCPYSCSFCFHYEPYRRRSLDSIFNELDIALKEYELEHIHFYDELFSADKDTVYQFCRRIVKYDLSFDVYMRIPDVTEEIVTILKDAGCISIGLGLESYSPDILNSMNKGIMPQQIDRALSIIHSCNMGFLGNFILGDTIDTEETVNISLEYRKAHPEYNINLYMIRTLPGSLIYKNACERGIIEDEVEFLKNDCPYVNVSQIPDQKWLELRELVNEEMLYSQSYVTDYRIELLHTRNEGHVIYTLICPHCNKETSFVISLLYSLPKSQCKHCLSYHTLDASRSVQYPSKYLNLDSGKKTVLWGANEICLKLIKNIPIFKQDNFIIVDKSEEYRQLRLCKKKVYETSIVSEVDTCIITAIRSKEQILSILANRYSNVKRIYLPGVIKRNKKLYFSFELLKKAQTEFRK